MAKILGLDLGANSIGWCLIDDELYNTKDDNGDDVNPILDSGVRVFEAGIENFGTSKEKSKNVERRDARLRRRQIQRKTRRLDYLVEALQKNNFIVCKTKFQESLIKDDPYLIRHNLINKEQDPLKFARALYHIAKHRGYHKLETAVSVGGDDDLSPKSSLVVGKDGQLGMAVLDEKLELDKNIEDRRYKTIGDYFYNINPHEIRIRNRYTRREYFTNEFEVIWEKQKEFYPSLYNNTAKEEIFAALFHRNKLKSQKDKIGKCSFEPKKPRAPKSHPLYQEFRMLQKINDLGYAKGDIISNKNKLTNEEKKVLIDLLSNTKVMLNLDKNKDVNIIKKKLQITETELNFNIEGKIYGLDTKIQIQKALGSKFLLSNELLNDIYQVLLFKDNNIWFVNYAQKKEEWKFNEEQAKELAKMRLLSGYGELSLKVIKEVLPLMRNGERYDIAMKKYLQKKQMTSDLKDKLKSLNFKIKDEILSKFEKEINTEIEKTNEALKNKNKEIKIYKNGEVSEKVKNSAGNFLCGELAKIAINFYFSNITKENLLLGANKYLTNNEDINKFNDLTKNYFEEIDSTDDRKFMGHNKYEHQVNVSLKEKLGEIPKVANPVVTVALHQIRQIVNNLIGRGLKPDEIHIELARDLGLSKEQRDSLKSIQGKNRIENDNALGEVEKLKKTGTITKSDLIKYRLWLEVKGKCPYTGKPIKAGQLFDETSGIEVEHIIPYSISFDNSFSNKTICYADDNRRKSNQTPYDFYSQKPEWSSFLARVNTLFKKEDEKDKKKGKKKKKKRISKLDRFKISREDYFELKGGGNDPVSQQLNDTRHIAILTFKYMQQICHIDNIVAVTGHHTAFLRHLWGFNSITSEILPLKEIFSINENDKSYNSDLNKKKDEKLRLDHRHHTIDAITIALTKRKVIQDIADFVNVYDENGNIKASNKHKKDFPSPWKNVRNNIKESLNNIIVAHRPQIKRVGKLHKETFYGLRKYANSEEMEDTKGQKLYSVRKSLRELSKTMINQIADPKIREMIIEYCDENLSDLPDDKIGAYLENAGFHHRTKTGAKIPIKKVRIRVPSSNMRQIANYNKWAEPGNNYAIVLFKNIEKDKTEGKVFTLLDAIRDFEKFNKDSIINWLKENISYEVEFINTLKANELIYHGNSFPDGFDIDDKDTYHLINKNVYRVQKLNYGDQKITFQQHTISKVSQKDVNDKELNPGRLMKLPNTLEFIKLQIDANGYLKKSES